jgi:aldehyde:ferredoxin oxidoreductase
MYGYCGKMLFVDLTKKKYEVIELTEDVAKRFIGGYGIGAKFLFERMKAGSDPLGPDNIIGFTTGPLTGTGAMFSGRYTVVCKSPVTGGWNDANSGGHFGVELKKAGFDAVFVQGVSETPVYVWINDGKVEIRDASNLWGKNVLEAEEALRAELGEEKIRVAMVGPAGEKMSLIAGVINDGHRAAGRGGSGAVMGSKKLKAVVVRGTGTVTVAEPEKLKAVNQEIVDTLKNGPMAEMVGGFSMFGTTGMYSATVCSGDAPVKNWGGAGVIDFGEEAAKGFEGPVTDPKYRVKKYTCANCPIGCGAIYDVKDGKWPVSDAGRPEYETQASFGCLILNKDFEALVKCNHICNLYGLDTISSGATLAWAIECYENGILTKDVTGGIELTWGNSEAVVQATQEMADQSTEFGKLLAQGSAGAAAKLGKGEEYLVTVKGIELPMHDSRFAPGLARTYIYDPTPGRHVKGGLGLQQMMNPEADKYNYEGTGEPDVLATAATEIVNTAGLCAFHDMTGLQHLAWKFIPPVTGWDFGAEEEKQTGLRIFNMRHAFNVREGFKPSDYQLPKRSVGEPPIEAGPLEGITIDYKALIDNFFEAIEWDKTTGKPSRSSLEKLGGMDDVIEAINL